MALFLLSKKKKTATRAALQSINKQTDAAAAVVCPPHTHTHTCPAKIPQTPMMQRMLKTAEPTMVPTPTSPWVMKTPAHREAANHNQQCH